MRKHPVFVALLAMAVFALALAAPGAGAQTPGPTPYWSQATGGSTQLVSTFASGFNTAVGAMWIDDSPTSGKVYVTVDVAYNWNNSSTPATSKPERLSVRIRRLVKWTDANGNVLTTEIATIPSSSMQNSPPTSPRSWSSGDKYILPSSHPTPSGLPTGSDIEGWSYFRGEQDKYATPATEVVNGVTKYVGKPASYRGCVVLYEVTAELETFVPANGGLPASLIFWGGRQYHGIHWFGVSLGETTPPGGDG